MSSQIQITGETKVKSLTGVLVGTTGVVSSLAFDVAGGVPKLDVNGKILVAQLPNSVMEYKGVWNAATNSPTLTNGGAFNEGDVYLCNVAGTVNFGAGPIAFFVGDQAIYSGSIWQRASGATGTVTSVAVTESGDSLNITGSPITTSGTINIGFNGTNLQYVNGAGNLTTFPILTGYVTAVSGTAPVVSSGGTTPAISMAAATGSVDGYLLATDFAIFNAKQSALTFSSPLVNTSGTISIPAATTSVNGYLASADFTTFNNKQNAITLTTTGTSGASTLVGATLNIPDYGSALTGYVTLATTQTITGAKTFSGYTTFTSTVDITSGLTFSNSGFTLVLQPPTLSVNRTVTLPNGTGTLALTSDISYPVTSVFGRTGAVVATSGDYTTAQVTESGNLYFTDSRARLALSFVAGSGAYNSTTGVITIPTNNNQITNGAGYTTNVGTVTSVAATGGTGISITGSPITTSGTITITNSAPDQTVALTASTGISVTGTYPNFTITNTSPSSGGTVTSVAALTIGTSGTDLSSTVATSTTTPVITLNVPTASATNRGALSSADWTTFNNKQGTITLTTTGTSGAATFSAGTLNIPNYGSGAVTGTGTTNYLPKFTGASTIGNSAITDDGTTVTLVSRALSGTSATFSGTLSTSAGFGILSGGGGYSVGPSATRGIIAVNGSGDQLLTFSTQSYIYNSSSLFRMLSSSDIDFVAGGTQRLLISASTGAATFSSSVTTGGNVNLPFQGALWWNDDGSSNTSRRRWAIASNYDTYGSLSFKVGTSAGSEPLSGTTVMNITNAGNVGIGTSSPSYKLQIGDLANTSSVLNDIFITGDRVNNDGYYARLIFGNSSQSGGSTASIRGERKTSNYATELTFYTNPSSSAGDGTEKMRITSGGALCLGVSSAYGTNLLNVNGGIYATSSVAAVVAADLDMMVFQNTGATYSKACLVASMTATGGTGSYFFYGQQSTSTAAIKIFSNGNIQNTNNSYGAISDARLKENIKDATPKLDDLMKVKVRNYNLKGESNKQLGVISQELEAIFPNMIEESTNMGENMKIKGVKYSVFVPMLIKAVQELKAEIEILKNK